MTATTVLACLRAHHRPSTDGQWCTGCRNVWPCESHNIMEGEQG